MENFYETEKTAVQEYLQKLGADDERYLKSLANYQKLIVCEKLDSECGTKMIEAKARENEARAKVIEAENRKVEAIGRVVSTIIETTGKVAITVGTSYLGFKSLLLVIEFEKDGNLPPKLMNLAKGLIVRA